MHESISPADQGNKQIIKSQLNKNIPTLKGVGWWKEPR